METDVQFYHTSLNCAKKENFSDEFVEKTRRHILCSKTFFFNCVVYDIVWTNIVQSDRPQMTIWRMYAAYWIPKASNAQSEYVKITAFPLQQWLHEGASLLRHIWCACPLNVKLKGMYSDH